MVITFKQGLLALSFLAAVSGGCTYNEDELRARHPDDDAPVDRPVAAPDLPVPSTPDAGSPFGSPVDAEVPDDGPAPDAFVPLAVDSHPDSKGVDAGIDSGTDAPGTPRDFGFTLPMDGPNDQSIGIFLPDTGISLPDARDLPTKEIDSAIDGSAVDASGLDGSRVIIIRVDATGGNG